MTILTNVDFWQNVVLVATLFFMITEFIRQRKEARRAIYQELHSAYLSFSLYCIEHPNIGLSDFSESEIKSFVDMSGASKELLDACNLLVALWENAYLMRSSMPNGQWAGWEKWMEDYLKNSEKVRIGVRFCIDQYDPNFVQFVKKTISEIEHDKKTT